MMFGVFLLGTAMLLLAFHLGYRMGERDGYRSGIVSRFPGAVARRQSERTRR